MALHDFECPQGHQFEAHVPWDIDRIKCQKCDSHADRVWVARRGAHRQLAEPIVIFKYPDGSPSFPGRNDIPTPSGAERVEIRTMGEYRREMRAINATENSRSERAREREHRENEAIHSELRSDLVAEMNQCDDPRAKALYREALSRYGTDVPGSRRSDIYAEAMEYDASNRDEYWEKGKGIRGRK